jgi:hypothetical protein
MTFKHIQEAQVLAFVFFLFSATLLNAQTLKSAELPCGTPPMTQEQMRYTFEVIAKQVSLRSAAITYVPLQAHIVRDDAGMGGLDFETLNKGLANLNYVFKTANIEFYWSGVPDYANNSDYYDFNAQAPDGDTNAGVRALFTVANNAINIYYVDKIINSTGFEASGYTFGPVDNPIYNFILMDKDYQISAVNGTFVHELGHFFALAHTFQGTENGNMNPIAENVPRSGVNANCATTGDFICDTQADPRGILAG